MLWEYSHTNYESLAQIHTIMAKIQHFSRGLFFIGAPCTYIHTFNWLIYWFCMLLFYCWCFLSMLLLITPLCMTSLMFVCLHL